MNESHISILSQGVQGKSSSPFAARKEHIFCFCIFHPSISLFPTFVVTIAPSPLSFSLSPRFQPFYRLARFPVLFYPTFLFLSLGRCLLNFPHFFAILPRLFFFPFIFHPHPSFSFLSQFLESSPSLLSSSLRYGVIRDFDSDAEIEHGNEPD